MCEAPGMTLRPLGDSAWLVAFPGISGGATLGRVMGLVAALSNNRPVGVLDVVPSFDTVAVHFAGVDGTEIREWIGAAEMVEQVPAGGERVIPVRYDGPDLAEVARCLDLTVAEVIALHSGAEYTVVAVGFSPGFPYLAGLPERLNLPRRRTPRLAVTAGAVAMAGVQAGIYPNISPGGWHVLGHTAVVLFDPHAEQPALLRAGDRVRFMPVERLEFAAQRVEEIGDLTDRWIEVIHPGGLTTVQDLGRPGYESSGVSPGGAVDRYALRVANLAAGNEEGAAALEICLSGPVLKFHAASTVVFMDGSGKPQLIAAGETREFSKPTTGVRAYLAVAGGLRVPMVLGSAATDLRAGFGGHHGRALQAGDRLDFGEAERGPRGGTWHVGRRDRVSLIELRYLPGVQRDWFSAEARQRFGSEIYQLTPQSDRMGVRLSGAALDLETPQEMVSQPVACGSVQVPPEGQPIVLLAERQTIGGYPQIGHVISVDLPKLARAWPGTKVRFREITLEHARELRQQEERDFAWLRTGLNLLT